MNEWTPCQRLVDEPDYWDPDRTAARRRRSGVAHALDDLQAFEVHHQADPAAALEAWERFARQQGDDEMPTFNRWARTWHARRLGLRWRNHPAYGGPPLAGLRYHFVAPVSGQYAIGYAQQHLAAVQPAQPPPPTRAVLTAAAAHEQLDDFARSRQLDRDLLWRQFADFWQTQPDDLEACLERFLGRLRLAEAYQPVFRVFDHFSAQLAESGQALGELAAKLARAADIALEARIHDGLMTRSSQPPTADPDVRDAIERRCKRCAQDHGSRPCRRRR